MRKNHETLCHLNNCFKFLCELYGVRRKNEFYFNKGQILSEALSFVLELEGKQVIGYKDIPDKIIKWLDGKSVSVKELVQLLLKCGKLKLIPIDYYYKIVVDDDPQISNADNLIKTCDIFMQ